MDDDSSGGGGRQQQQAKSKEGPQAASETTRAQPRTAVANAMAGSATQSMGSVRAEKENTTAMPAVAKSNTPPAKAKGGPPLQKPAGALAQIPSKIRHESTPNKVPNRIPPRIEYKVSVSVNNLAADGAPVRLFIEGSGGNNGEVLVNGNPEETVNAAGSYELTLLGTAQTEPGNAGKLRLAAEQNGKIIQRSGGFTVSALPLKWTTNHDEQIQILNTPQDPESEVGMVVNEKVDSDSGQPYDLSEIKISERVQNGLGNGYLKTAKPDNSGYLKGSRCTDTHAYNPRKHMNEPSWLVQSQTAMFLDKRTGVKDIPVKNSGFNIRHTVSGSSRTSYMYTITKFGARATAHGITSDAGSGNANSGPITVP